METDDPSETPDQNTENFLQTVEKIVDLNHIKKIQLEEISLIKKIGEGGQAKVYMGTYQNEKVAVKLMKNVDYKCFAHELVILALLDHENIPKFYGIIREKNVLSLVFEFIEGRTLDQFKISEFTTEQKYNIIYQLTSCLEYIHSKKFIHRDLKPENIMLDNQGKIHLLDFSIAKVITNAEFTLTRAKGTLNYLAPECLELSEISEDQQIISKITSKVDVWAFGCIVSWLFSGYVPWSDKYKDLPPIIQQILMKKIPFSIPKNIEDKNIIKIIEMATQVDVNKRKNMKEIKDFLDTCGIK
jgi:serine/threonine protein kinase